MQVVLLCQASRQVQKYDQRCHRCGQANEYKKLVVCLMKSDDVAILGKARAASIKNSIV